MQVQLAALHERNRERRTRGGGPHRAHRVDDGLVAVAHHQPRGNPDVQGSQELLPVLAAGVVGGVQAPHAPLAVGGVAVGPQDVEREGLGARADVLDHEPRPVQYERLGPRLLRILVQDDRAEQVQPLGDQRPAALAVQAPATRPCGAP